MTLETDQKQKRRDIIAAAMDRVKPVADVANPLDKVSTEVVELSNNLATVKSDVDKKFESLLEEVNAIKISSSKVDKINSEVKNLSDGVKNVNTGLKNFIGNQEQINLQHESMIDSSNLGSSVKSHDYAASAAELTSMLQDMENERTNTGEDPKQISPITSQYYEKYRGAFYGYLRLPEKDTHQGLKYQADMQRGIDPDGGYLAPVELTKKIMRLSEEINPILKHAKVIKTNRAAVEGFINTGLPDCRWGGEAQPYERTRTPSYGKWRIDIKKLYAYPRLTPEQVADSDINLESEVFRLVGNETSKLIGTASLTGNGILDMRGLYSYPFKLTEPTGTDWQHWRYIKSGSANTIDSFDPFVQMYGALDPIYRKTSNNVSWFMNRKVWTHLMTLKDANGHYFINPNFKEHPDGIIMGSPIVIFDGLNDLAKDTYPVWYGALSEAYTVILRESLTITRENITEPEWYKYNATMRIGGGAQNFQALLAMKCEV